MRLRYRWDGNDDTVVVADRMTITDSGTLIFWRGHEGQYADAIHLAIASGHWVRVEAQS